MPAPTLRNPQSTKRFILRLALLSAAVLLLILTVDALRPLVQTTAPNPPERHTGVIVDGPTDALLRRACFDCHSNETRWPWYTRLPGVASLARRDVLEGRDELNFSRWDSMGPGRRAKALKESVENMREGEMPPWFYTFMHPDAAIDGQAVAAFASALGPLVVSGESKGRDGHEDEDEDDEKKRHRKKNDD